MDWRSVNFDWNRARAFLVTAEEGSLSAAARALGLAQPTLGRQVDALEQELGVVLFERVGRGLRLTPAGHELIDHARVMGEAASRMSMTAFGQNEAMEGEVSIAASDAYAGLLLPPILEKLREAEPRIRVQLVVSNSASDLLRREADIAVRNFRPEEPDLVARKIREAGARLYGSNAYLDSLGPLHEARDLARASFIAPDNPGVLLGLLNRFGMELTEGNFPLQCADFLVMWEMVKRGMGLGIIDERIGDAEPRVRRALPGLAPMPFPVWLVAHREIHRNRRLRFVFDFLADGLK
ncbi:LysR family transcriptional regulator [Sinisalibacter aestuarii]|uniref:LysR family transcriptional regulator n=1 Tax=Sinisalibacter aestuarii TaxID=2949426 RepID=A0ABQ5LW85_9RHOB|nr:LysR family transcriptional regulator [Sinisalibacter aestuarii]GKY88878.1 LysR family transcriptional regulator [Sinisalibacter aestuarii]